MTHRSGAVPTGAGRPGARDLRARDLRGRVRGGTGPASTEFPGIPRNSFPRPERGRPGIFRDTDSLDFRGGIPVE
ncbi:hypothetical protein SSCG_02400 [Streptomyces clavuligerus]|nr:hypothetical protein SSCG_02400 [Streptomyces clavuligerus]